MEFLQNQNLTLGQPEVIHWEPTTQISSAAVNNTIVVLGVLTFALQLCLALLFMLRCWRLDNSVREALKHPDSGNKLSAPQFFHADIYEQAAYQLGNDTAAASSPATSAAPENHEHRTGSLYAPFIHWDLVQG